MLTTSAIDEYKYIETNAVADGSRGKQAYGARKRKWLPSMDTCNSRRVISALLSSGRNRTGRWTGLIEGEGDNGWDNGEESVI
ncbi:hypothetical protein EVAR_85749_1 [Eumeta japonica]|uniref:Uncharacterized protein n=1 Tax=Eumeta variegata TaxID=151549 RepID=A0A4C1ZDG8_EUMVA|nr:hypothetical protein EVAR_85749_1 [Eumeta japonica]